jgi:hypothetical protein
MLRYRSTEFADDCSYLAVIFSSAKAGAQLSDSVIGVGGHNIAAQQSPWQAAGRATSCRSTDGDEEGNSNLTHLKCEGQYSEHCTMSDVKMSATAQNKK